MLESHVKAGRKIWFTGHSLGAALATLAASSFSQTQGICTFGCPLVGDDVFARTFASQVGGRSFRYVNNLDVVTHVPLRIRRLFWMIRLLKIDSYRHVAAGKQIDDQGAISDSEASAGILRLISQAPRDIHNLFKLLAAGRLEEIRELPAFLLDHTPRRYAVRVWNDLLPA